MDPLSTDNIIKTTKIDELPTAIELNKIFEINEIIFQRNKQELINKNVDALYNRIVLTISNMLKQSLEQPIKENKKYICFHKKH